jgi:putative membrane protein
MDISISTTIAQYLLYLKYMGLSIFMVVAFTAIYVHTTPIKEITLIKQGNIACALSFGGAIVGFSIALASSIMHSMDIIGFIIWSIAAAILQILIYFVVSHLIKDGGQQLRDNNIAVGLLYGLLSIAIGLVNGASLS